jgi:acetyl-CoA synthetase
MTCYCNFNNLQNFKEYYQFSIKNREEFWKKAGDELIWENTYTSVFEEDYSNNEFEWYVGGKLDILKNTILKHKKEKIAFYDYENKKSYSYGDISEKTSQLLNNFENIGKDEKIILFLPSDINYYLSVLALSHLSITYIPLSFEYSLNYIKKIINEIDPVYLLIDSKFKNEIYAEKLNEISEICKTFDVSDFKHETANNEKRSSTSESTLFIHYPSTGSSILKGYEYITGAYLTHANLVYNSILGQNNSIIFDDDALSTNSQMFNLWGPLLNGDTIIIYNKELNKEFILDISKDFENLNLISSPRKLLKMKNEFGDEILKNRFKKVISTGDFIGPRLIKQLSEIFTKEIKHVINVWSQTATGVPLFFTLPFENRSKIASIGYPSLGISPIIVNNDDKECSINESGEINFSKHWPGMAKSIYKNNELFNRLHFNHKNYFITNDGVRKDEDGCFWFMKRLDDVMKVEGFSVSTFDIEQLLTTHKKIREAAVIGIEGYESGDQLAIFISPEENENFGNSEQFKSDIVDFIKENLGNVAIPSFMFVIKELPRTKTGKIVRRLLHRIAKNDVSPKEDFSHLSNPLSVQNLLNERGE